jgi:hypothetical protein
MLEYWYRALRSERGIVVRAVDCDRDAMRQALYRARKEAADIELEALSIVMSPTANDELWIIHNAKA